MILLWRAQKPFLCMLLLALLAAPAGCKGRAVSGQTGEESEPSSGTGLQIEQYLGAASVRPPDEGRPMALIVPEGRSSDSYMVAAHGLKTLSGLQLDTVVLVGQMHGPSSAGALVYAEGVFATPFGDVSVDRELASDLLSRDDGVVFDPHLDRNEYVSDFMLGALRRVLGKYKVVPVLIGNPEKGAYDRLVNVLARVLTKKKGRRVLLVAMTDLATGMTFDDTSEADARTVASLMELNAARTQGMLRKGDVRLTGWHAALVVMEAARRAGADMSQTFNYAIERYEDGLGAGYVAMGYYDTPLGDVERVELLTLARRTVGAAVRGVDYEPAVNLSPRLMEPGAAFVTLEKNYRLRGGIGQVQATGPLFRSVIMSARAAAMEDDRFSPMSFRELDELNYEVSVLTTLVPVLDVRKDIELGTHGLYLNLDGRSGMLLPQVPVEQKWDLDEYLRQISLRAGLPPDAWKDQDTRLWTFTTEIVR